MKFMLVFASFLSSSLAAAALSKGDFVRYRITQIQAGKTQILDQKIEVSDVNRAEGNYTTRITLSTNGSILSQSLEVQDLGSASEAESTVDHCSQLPAEIASHETIQVTAGTFKVCHLKSESEGSKLDQYMGKVLFGLVKSTLVNSTENKSMIYELIEQKRN